MIKTSKFSILFKFKKYIFILILPLISGLSEFFRNGRLVLSMIMLLTELIFILFLALLEWKHTVLILKSDYLIFNDGSIIKKSRKINKSRFVYISFQRNLFLFITGGIRVSLSTGAKKGKEKDISIIIKKQDAKLISDFFNLKEGDILYKASPSDCIFSAINGGLSAKLFFIAPLIREIGKIIRSKDPFYSSINQTVRGVSQKIFYFVPEFLSLIAFILFVVWGISVVISLFKSFKFKLFRSEKFFVISHGVIDTEIKYILTDSVNSIYKKETPISCLFKRVSFHFASPAVNSDDMTSSAFILSTAQKRTEYFTNKFLGFNDGFNRVFKSNKNSISFFVSPITAALIVLLACVSVIWLFPDFAKTTILISIIFSIFILISFAMLLRNSKLGGFKISENFFFVYGKSGFSAKFGILNRRHIDLIKLRQSPFQQKNGTANIYFYPKSKITDRLTAVSIKTKFP